MLFLPVFFSIIPFAALRIVGSRTMKRFFFSFLWRMPLERLERYAEDFVDTEIIPQIHPELLNELTRNKKEGRYTILNTASPQIYIPVLAGRLGFDSYLSTLFIMKDPMPLIPGIRGENNKRMAKLFSMIDLLPITAQRAIEGGMNPYRDANFPVLKNSIAYSDSPADLPMLCLCEHAVLIEPRSRELMHLAEKRGWQIVQRKQRPRPFIRLITMLRQILGLYDYRYNTAELS